MFREFVSILRSPPSDQGMSEDFGAMLRLSVALVRRAGEAYFQHAIAPEERAEIGRQDTRINKLERRIRKKIIVNQAMPGNSFESPHCLRLMSLVKDVERIGDYAKELIDLIDLTPDPLPEIDLVSELRVIRLEAEANSEEAIRVYEEERAEQAVELIRQGRGLIERSETFLLHLARDEQPAGVVLSLGMASRFYKRISGHTMNLLSGVVMPLHRLDYYDERDIARARRMGIIAD